MLPGAIFGPPLPGVSGSSTAFIAGILRGAAPGQPKVEMAITDVRDLAELHVLAMTSPDAPGTRLLGTGEVLSMVQIAQVLRDGLGPDAAKVSTRTLPDWLIRLMARINPPLRSLPPMLGRRLSTRSRAHAVVGWVPRPAAETIVDTGRALLADPTA